MLRCFSLGFVIGAMMPWVSFGFPFKWNNVRQNVINAQGNHKSILDIGCGVGFSTSSSQGSLGIDTDPESLFKAKRIFPEKNFEFGDVLFWKPRHKYDVVTSMFYLHENPRYIRKKIIELALQSAKERIIFVDFSPEYSVSQDESKDKPYLKNYLRQCREELRDFEEHVIIEGKVHIWIKNLV